MHNLELDECIQSINEISRLSNKNSFITVDAYRNDEERERMLQWNLTAKTIMSVDRWKKLFKDINYKGDFIGFSHDKYSKIIQKIYFDTISRGRDS